MLTAALVVAFLAAGGTARAAESEQQQFIHGVSRDIGKLKSEFPQLAEFSSTKHSSVAQLKISYDYHTHRPEPHGGWTSGVPNPDDDGIWFYIDLHDPASKAEIHTQPMIAPICFDGQRVTFLILEGTKTKAVGGRIAKILTRHGAKPCGR